MVEPLTHAGNPSSSETLEGEAALERPARRRGFFETSECDGLGREDLQHVASVCFQFLQCTVFN